MARDRTAEAERARGERGERMQRARRRRKQANGAQADEDRKPTERVILKRERVLVLPDGVEPGALDELLKAVRKHGRIVEAQAWVEVAQTSGGKRKAIEAHAGVAGTPSAKPGLYKAPTLTAWKGGREYERPPEPLVQARDID